MIVRGLTAFAMVLFLIVGFSSHALAVPCESASSEPNTADCSSTIAGSGTVTIDKEFTDPSVPIDIVFTIAKPPFGDPGNSPASYGFAISETVVNSTGVAWNDFHMRLGLGTGAEFMDFFVAEDPDVEFGTLFAFDGSVRGFDASSDKFSIVALSQHSPRALDFFGGTVLPGESVTFSLSIVEGNIPTSDGSTFTFREIPSVAARVPEPATLTLLGIGFAGLALLRRRMN